MTSTADQNGLGRGRTDTGQAIVEFALASTLFLLVVLGTIDLGRAVYVNSTLHNAVREGRRVGKMQPTNTSAIRSAVVNHAPGLGLTSSAIAVSCSGSCATGDAVTVGASLSFTPIALGLLKVGSFTISASAKGEIE